MKSAFLILAAYQITASAPPQPYMDRHEKEALEKQESAVCGPETGYYGMVDAPIYVEAPKKPKVCKTKPPEVHND